MSAVSTGFRAETMIYRRVTWPGYVEVADIDHITDLDLELSYLTDLKATGSITVGDAIPDFGHDLVRIYYSFTDAAGQREVQPLGTFFATNSQSDYSGDSVSGSFDLKSVLRVPASKRYGRPYTVVAGTNSVAKAAELLTSLGLKVQATPSDHRVGSDMVFEEGDSYLTMANALLDAAGYASCMPNPLGVVMMAPYVEPKSRSPVYDFAPGEYSLLERGVTVTNNADDLYNAVRLTYGKESNDETWHVWASAVNASPDSPISTACAGYEVTYVESATDLEAETADEALPLLMERARSKLEELTQDIEYREWKHGYVPIAPGDPISLSDVKAGAWRGSLTDLRMTFGGSRLACTSRARSFVKPGFVSTVEGGSW